MSAKPRHAVHLAEDVLPGHPDRLADAVAESIVDCAVADDPTALVGVEVGVHRKVVFVTGRVACWPDGPFGLDLEALVSSTYAGAGYVGHWALSPQVIADVDLCAMSGEEDSIRGFSDDQSITVGKEGRPTQTNSSVRVTLNNVDGRWLISGFDPI